MQFDELRREIGEPSYYLVSPIAGWCLNVMSSLSRAGGQFEDFHDFPYQKQKAIIGHYVLLQRKWSSPDARRAARLMQLYCMAASEGDEELAESIYGFMVAHGETMLRRWRRMCRLN